MAQNNYSLLKHVSFTIVAIFSRLLYFDSLNIVNLLICNSTSVLSAYHNFITIPDESIAV